ncbi:MAG: indole-3-glycerol phosphate synthase TrpC [Candidatus Margulisiibacteriota bacterium]
MILDEIIASKIEEVKMLKEKYGTEHFAGNIVLSSKDFADAIKEPVSLIAEVKKASPSAGTIRQDFDPLSIALSYERSGAKAVSVLTDKKYFKGSTDYLKEISGSISLPVLRKDFIIDEIQIYEARYYGADALLLIASVLTDEKIKKLSFIAAECGMDVLLEVHDKTEMLRALECGAGIIGINNRNLKTFKVNFDLTFELAALVPGRVDRILVSESGIGSPDQIKRLKKAGINAALIGEELMKAPDIGKKIKELGFKQ